MPESTDHPANRVLPILCTHCGVNSVGEVVASYEEHGLADMPTSLLQLAKCGKCSQAILLIEEDYGNGWDGHPVTVWPPDQSPISWQIPEALRRELAEAQKCFSVKSYTAAAVMVRRTLEGVCLDQGVSTSRPQPLMRMLESLRDAGKIEGRLFEWSQALRALGNDAAHYTGRTLSEEDAADALGLAEALLDYIYVYSPQFEKFSARRSSRRNEDAP